MKKKRGKDGKKSENIDGGLIQDKTSVIMEDEEFSLTGDDRWPIAVAVKEDEELIITGSGIILPRTSSSVLRKLGKRHEIVKLVDRIIAENFSCIEENFIYEGISEGLLKEICRVLSKRGKRKSEAEKWNEYYGKDGEAWNYRISK